MLFGCLCQPIHDLITHLSNRLNKFTIIKRVIFDLVNFYHFSPQVLNTIQIQHHIITRCRPESIPYLVDLNIERLK